MAPGRSLTATWRIEDGGGVETAWVTFAGSSLAARGRAVGLTPHPYWLEYELDTGEDFVTRRLQVRLESGAGERSLELCRSPQGAWSADGHALPDLEGALDCDLARSPLTNTMPVLRHRLHVAPGSHDLVMAWVAVPDLAVVRSAQRYEHLEVIDAGARVRYTSQGSRRTFTGVIRFDSDGLVVDYPELGRRLQETTTVRG